MQGAGTEHFAWLRGRAESAAGYGSGRIQAHLVALDSIAVSTACLWILCLLNPPHAGGLARASFYVLLSCGIGALNFWVLGPRRERGFGRMMARLAMSWVVVPPAVLLLRADSWLCVFAGVLMGATFALAMADGREWPAGVPGLREPGLRFALFEAEASPSLPPWTALLLSVLIFATVFALGREWLVAALVLGAVCAAMAGFRWSKLQEGATVVDAGKAREARRLAALVLASIVVTSTLLMPERVKQAQAEDLRAMQAMMHALQGPAAAAKKPKGRHAGSVDLAGVPKVFLWPEPPKKARVLMAPVVADKARVIHRSLVIPFSGPYIYTEVAGLRTKPLVAKGSPLKVKVSSVDGSPISMVARQRLATPIDVASCGVIEVTVRQGVPATATGLALVLSNTGERHGAQVRLATEPLARELLPEEGLEGMAAGEQTVRFAVPEGAKLRSFDQMEVLVRRLGALPHGARMVVESFTLRPR